jgi:uncharacterized protein YbdZ (MbtH family)
MSVRDADAEDTTVYKVVINHEEQYSIWPESRENPPGWTSIGVTGPKAACLSHIESVWTDMRPLSLRKAMEEAAAQPQLDPEPAAPATPPEDPLPVRLSRGSHPVELCVRPERTMDALARQIDTGYVHVRFTSTRGGTELAFPLDLEAIDRIKSQVARGEGPLQVSGSLTLDYIPVRCIADIDLATFTGTGALQILAS